MSLVERTKPRLPDAKTVLEAVKKWATTQPGLAAFLNAGLSPAESLSRWGLGLVKANHPADAAEVFRATLALAPSDPVLWSNFGMALSQIESTAEAIYCFEHSLGLSKEQPITWLMLGMAKKKLNDAAGAEGAYRAALDLNPNSATAWQLLGILKEEQKDFTTAAQCLEANLKIAGPNAAVLANLGKLRHQIGRFAESNDAYAAASELDPGNAHYRQMARKTRFFRDALEVVNMNEATERFRQSFVLEDVCTEKILKEVFQSAFHVLGGFGHTGAALRIGQKWGELWPTSASLAYLMSAVAGDQTIERSPAEYVVEYFDSFAEGFDAQLVGALGYDVPEKICPAIRSILPSGRFFETLDAGCGTGLCGPLLKPFCKPLAGVDLSQKMLDQAQRKGFYDSLACEDAAAYFRRSPRQFELIVAADLMIYFGELGSLFADAADALKPGGHFAFSTELWNGEGPHRLNPSGRFAHATQYVRSVAAPLFEEVSATETTIRLDGTQRLAGNIFIFRRRAD